MPVEIHLNRRGINSIEVHPEVAVTAGSDLALEMINHGAPLHLTLSSQNSGMFTDFFHANLYVADREAFIIPIRPDSYPGFFDVAIITGYGAKRAAFRVVVHQVPPEVPEEPEELPPHPQAPARRIGVALPAGFLVAAGLVLYGLWLAFRLDMYNYTAFLALLAGVLMLWFSRRS
ncbi:hypothetical protein ABH15_01330 [Methanoculleus taiwanensis]|uniref:Uncharacterized protein n=1 Tax=Methanoculleus taiwanensis TaxID=1550565 RepID=A0A498H409_9EURY|nr:hypothetical protein [Methanoculleus taiwanensis]RXE56828.1 hypothetical protein ABH15_01330 [Methanoculleus taiwanensis]